MLDHMAILLQRFFLAIFFYWFYWLIYCPTQNWIELISNPNFNTLCSNWYFGYLPLLACHDWSGITVYSQVGRMKVSIISSKRHQDKNGFKFLINRSTEYFLGIGSLSMAGVAIALHFWDVGWGTAWLTRGRIGWWKGYSLHPMQKITGYTVVEVLGIWWTHENENTSTLIVVVFECLWAS